MNKLYLPTPMGQVGGRRIRGPLAVLLLSTAMLGSPFSRAQSPGGVPVAAWWRADASGTLFSDAGVTPATDSSQLYQWNDATGHDYNLTQTSAGNRPIFSNAKTLANFNPSVTFNTDYMQYIPATGDTIINRTDGTLYAAGKMNIVGNTGFLGFDASNDFPGLHTYPVAGNYKLLFFSNGGPGYQGLSHNSFSDNATFIAGAGWVNNGGSATGYLGATVSLNGDTAVYSGAQMLNVNANASFGEMRVGWDSNWGALNGQLNELMVFENKLTYPQMQQVESYMAIKYGTTLDSGHVNYVSSSGSTIWSAASNAGNNHNIAGIARDDNGSLYQKQSWSTNTGKQVLISTTGLANTNAANTGTLTDGQYLIWGDNGQAKYPGVAITGVAGANYRFNAIWKVQNTGTVGTVRVAWPKTWNNITLLRSADSTFDGSDVATNMSAHTQTINGVVYNYADVTFTNGQYFTFAILAQSPGGITTLPAVWYRPDNVSSSQWQDASINTLDLTSENGTTVKSGDRAHNFHSWTTNYSATQYYNYLDNSVSNTNLEINPVLGNYNVNGYSYTPLTVFGVARDTFATGGSGLITGMDNEKANASEPGFGVYGAQQRFYRFSYGAAASGGNVPINMSAVYMWRPTTGGAAASGTDTLLMGLNGAYSKSQMNKVGSVAGPYLKIGYSASDWGAFPGDIQEVIWYKDSLGYSDIRKVETYLALKYGTTLAHSYVAASGATIYDLGTDTTYRYNIAGIGREDANGGLNQRQSNSVYTGNQVLISTTGLGNTNDSNAVQLANAQYLIWGDNGRAKAPAVAITGIAGVNYRFGAVWKAQNTNSVGTVRVAWPKMFATMKLVQSADTTFDATDIITNMSDTQVVNGITYAYADVILSNGQYFTFSAFVQAPGGVVANLLMWHKADDGVTAPGAKSIWKDVSVNGRDVTQNNNVANQPALVTASADTADSKVYFFNYNPFYYFDGTNDFFYRQNDNYFPATTSAGSTYGVMFNSASGGWRTPYGWGDDDPNIVRGNGDYAITRDNGTVIQQNVNADNISAHIGGFSWKGSGAANNGIYLNVNGRVYGTTAYNIGNIDDNFAIGSEGFALTGNGNELFQGGIPEVFAYSSDHQNAAGNEKQRINSYLAIKYGITLSNDSGTAVPNYLSSTSNTVWNATANAGYNNNIGGLAYDYNSALQQKQSVSENAGKQVLIGTTGLANTNAQNTTALTTDGQFLIWGDNGQAKAPSVYMGNAFSSVNVRFKSVWKVQNTGSIGTVRVAWPADGLNNLSLIRSADTTFDASDVVTNMSANTQTINGVIYNYADVTLPNGQYFTFASKIDHAPGGVFTGLSYWYRADKNAVNTGDSTNATSWTDYASGTVVGQMGSNPYPLYRNGNAQYFNFNPGLLYTDGAQALGNMTVQTATDTSYDIFTLTKEGIQSGGANPRVFSSLVNNAETTGNIHYWDGIGLNADGNIERENQGYTLHYYANPGNINYANNSPSIMYNSFTNNAVSKGLNGARNGAAGILGPFNYLNGGHIFGSTQFSGNGSDNAGFKGSLGEAIIYGSNNLTSEERNKVDAYLAIKYGITLDTSKSYLTSGSAVVWDKNANKPYYNNVAGIGRDDLSALFQKQSRSQIINNANGEITIGLGDIYNTNLNNPDSIVDGQFMIWGDNGNTQAMTNVATTYATFTYNGSSSNRRMKRTWKVQNTGVAHTVKLRFPVTSVGTTTLTSEDACTGYAIIYASDSGFTSGLVVAPLSTNGTNYEALNDFPQGASYFTFAKITSLAPGVVVLPDTAVTAPVFSACASNTWKYAKLGATTNKYFAISGMTPVQLNNLSVTITPTGGYYNGNGRETRLMSRVTTVNDASNGTYTGLKVRVYYSNTEKQNTSVANAQANNWIKYEGNAAALISDVNTDGVLNSGTATMITPDVSGVEDGVSFVDFYNVSSFSSFAFISSTETIGTVLPVTMISFTAERQGNTAILRWSTANEQRNKGFDIQHSADSKAWRSIGFVNSAALYGNSDQKLDYSYTDKAPANGMNYYRLKQTDFDGRYVYSVIRQLSFSNNSISVHPNPVTDYLTIDGLSGGESIKVYDAAGKMIKEIRSAQSSAVIDLSAFSQGSYNIFITTANGTIVSRKIVKVN